MRSIVALDNRKRRRIVAAMAATLCANDAAVTEREAIRFLMWKGGFRPLDIAALSGDALFEAQLHAIADTMADA